MTSSELHPAELAYALSYAKADGIIGWGEEPFRPADGTDAGEWFALGEARLVAAGRLTGTPEQGLNFTPDTTSAVLTLVDPAIVLLAQRKAGVGLQKLTVHAARGNFVGLSRQADGLFDLTTYADLTAAAAAGAAFVGASPTPRASESRIETDRETLSALTRRARAGEGDAVVAELVQMGLAMADATSAVTAMAAPTAAGVLSMLYCRDRAVANTESFSVMTNAMDDTWIIFAPASPDGPMILERSSLAALTARVAVGVAARLTASG